MTRRFGLLFLMLASTLGLGACGNEWEAQLTNTVLPYGNQRTAGSGVIYVRKNMLQEKELKLEPVVIEERTVVTPAPAPVADHSAPMFNETQKK